MSVRSGASSPETCTAGAPSGGPQACRRCTKGQAIAWGHFYTRNGEARQRYRCLSCNKTFSVHTGTALEDIKMADRWPGLTQCMAEGISLRATSARLGIHLSTAFRWRHRLLDALGSQPKAKLQGEVAAALAYVPYSEKGSAGTWNPWPPVSVLLLCDERQRSLATPIAFGLRCRPCPGDAAEFPLDRLASDAVLCTMGKSRYFQCLCRDLGLGYQAKGQPRLAVGIGALRTGLSRWLRRFHGVATKYLEKYLCWFQVAISLCRPSRSPATATLSDAAAGT